MSIARVADELQVAPDTLRRWERELDNRAAPLLKQLDQLRGFLASDMAKAIAYLDQVLKALEAYRNIIPGRSPAPPLVDDGHEPAAPEGQT